jgi:hypothetical protein
MKGVTHYIAGIAAASCLPAVVAAAADGNPLYFMLAGLTGLLPDTLDFKCYRYFYPCRDEVIPDSRAPDAQGIADALARAVARAQADGAASLRLSTVRLSGDRWLPYRVTFAPARREVTVTFEQPDDDDPTAFPLAFRCREATAPLPCDILLEGDAATRVDILDGPIWAFRRSPGQGVHAAFIPWHRQWTHSFVCVALIAALALLANGTAACVVLLAGGLHILMDQLGHMGSAIWWPFCKPRIPGLQLAHASDSWPNLAAIWLALLLLFWNLARLTPDTALYLNPIRLFVWAGFVPLLAARLILPR